MGMTAQFRALRPAKLDALIEDPSGLSAFLAPAARGQTPDGYLDLDKSWQGVHFLLTGDPWEGPPPLSWAILGGEEIGDDLGYGPARYLTAEQVAEVAAALAAVTHDQLRERFGTGEPLTAAGIYPRNWADLDDAVDWLTDSFDRLTAFYDRAAQRNQAMLLYLC